jgi:3-hydroxyacyl-[acyl-carrier-protein] dehydratase
MRYLTVDRLVDLDPGRSARAIRNVTLTEDVFATHFPNFPVLPGVLVTDTMSQVAAWACASRFRLERKARLVGLRGAKFRHYVRPGDQLLVAADHVCSDGERDVWRAKATVDGKLIALIAELEFVVEPVPEAYIARERERFAWAGGDRLLAHAIGDGIGDGISDGISGGRST